MSESEPRSGKAAMVSALDVPRNAAVGFALSALFTAAVFALFVLPGTRRPMALYVALAFVLIVSLGGLATALLTAVSAVKLARR
ncbi:DUF7536 family protein [Haloarcula salina]|nr:hypothetical protein [Haloarcula salina]